MAGQPSLSTVRQVKICSMTGARSRVLDEPGLSTALRGLERHRVRDPVGGVSVGRSADVPPVHAMLDQPFPDFLLQLEPVPFRHSLLYPADKNRGGVNALDIGGLVGGEKRDALAGQFLFQFQRVEHVAAGPFDVLAHHGGEPGRGRASLAEQVGHAAVAGQVRVGELPPVLALAAGLQVEAAGLDVPVDGGDEPPGREPGAGGAELPVQGRAGVLQREGGGPADERDRDRLSRHGGWRHGCLCWHGHCGTSTITRARRFPRAFPGGYPDLEAYSRHLVKVQPNNG